MNHADLFTAIQAERVRQNEKHPVLPKYMLNPKFDPLATQIRESMVFLQIENDFLEANGGHSWYGILYEELKEVFAAETKEEREKEIVQAIAVLVRMYENL